MTYEVPYGELRTLGLRHRVDHLVPVYGALTEDQKGRVDTLLAETDLTFLTPSHYALLVGAVYGDPIRIEVLEDMATSYTNKARRILLADRYVSFPGYQVGIEDATFVEQYHALIARGCRFLPEITTLDRDTYMDYRQRLLHVHYVLKMTQGMSPSELHAIQDGERIIFIRKPPARKEPHAQLPPAGRQ